jgi:hypothetical protein
MSKIASEKGYKGVKEMKQRDAINNISKGIFKTSNLFDLDDEEETTLDKLIEDKVVMKSLESDNLIFMEG